MSIRSHWEGVYRTHPPNRVSWYREHLDASLALIRRSGIANDAAIIDVGAGASMLVDDLLAAGFTRISVLDVSRLALLGARARLGDAADRVRWIEADVTEVDLGGLTFDLWHDRAALHFLIDPEHRRRYVRTLRTALAPGGYFVLGTFAPAGPRRCSGLDVVRYGAAEVRALLGDGFEMLSELEEVHTTPAGGRQAFAYFLLQRNADCGANRAL